MRKVVNISQLFCLILLLQFETRQAAKWHDQKFSHASKPISVAHLKKMALQTPRTSFQSLVEPILIPRVVGSEGHTRVREYLVDQMKALNWDIELDTFDDDTPFGRKTFSNIIATLNPNVPRRLVIACHYDSKYVREYTFIGATDSAVPCAMMLHLAQTLQQELADHKNSKQDVTLQFVFFDGEEAFVEWTKTDSIYGARHLANKWANTPYAGDTPNGKTTYLDRIDMMVLLDLLGTSNPTFLKFFEPTSHWYDLMSQTEKALKKHGLRVGSSRSKNYFQDQRSYGGIEDDHIPFLQRGVPILHVISAPFPTVWHTEQDNKDALDYNTIENLNRILRVFVASYLHLPS